MNNLIDAIKLQQISHAGMWSDAHQAVIESIINEAMEGKVIVPVDICNEIATQNNRITQDPIFAVEKEVTDWDYDSEYCDEYKWVYQDGDYQEADEEKAGELEELDYNCESTGSWAKCYFKRRWEFVTCCFTEKGCNDYIKSNGHNLGKTRVYVHSAYRNSEWINLRAAILSTIRTSGE